MEESNSKVSTSAKSNRYKGPYKPPKPRGGGLNPPGKEERNENTSSKSSRPPRTNNAPQRVKIIIRKLPATRDYTQEDFKNALDGVLAALNIEKSVCNFEHFIPGKIR